MDKTTVVKRIGFLLFLVFSLSGCHQIRTSPNKKEIDAAEASYASYSGSGSLTQGVAETQIENLFMCPENNSRIAGIGTISDLSGKTWTVPGENHFGQANAAFDLYNDCTKITPTGLGEVDLNSVPLVEIDPDGEIITGYIFADNYFEIYINGILIGVDPVPFTPFNSNIVKFKVNAPYTIAVKLIDWEENLGIGSERNRGNDFHAGDGGFIASFSDGTVTNGSWKAQTFYTSPISDPRCLKEIDGKRLSGNCKSTEDMDAKELYGVHWKIPDSCFDSAFDDSAWPHASTYTEEVIGVDNKNAYMNFIEMFTGKGAEFIWSTNVVLDNEVIVRRRVE